MSPEEFNRNFRIAPVYLFVGEEEFYKVEGIARIRSAVLPTPNDEMGFTEWCFSGRPINSSGLKPSRAATPKRTRKRKQPIKPEASPAGTANCS